MIGMSSLLATRAQLQAASMNAELNVRAAMDARAYCLWQIHGDAYAGMTLDGQPILWRETTIPKVMKGGCQA